MKECKPAALAGYRILLADDDPDTLEYFSMVLEDSGAEIIRANDGIEALELAQREKPDLVVLDLDMPGKDGGEVFEAIRKDPALSETKVCISTARPERRRLIYERPVPPPENYLNKPVSDKVLLLNVQEILEFAEIKR